MHEKPEAKPIRGKYLRLISEGELFLNSNIYISIKNQYVFFENPKVASTTIKQQLVDFEVHSIKHLNIKPVLAHDLFTDSPHIKPYQLSESQLISIIDDLSFVKFCIVRNPYERVLSVYLDKIVRSLPQLQLVQKYRVDDRSSEIPTFSQFLVAVEQMPDHVMDKHWRPQTSLLKPKMINYDIIGRLENFSEFVKNVNKLLKYPALVDENTSPHKTNSASLLQEKFDQTSIDLVNRIYSLDFSLLGYEKISS